ncbi:MAG: hypothetical protein V6Z78_00210 [Holosporaceae bacterium]
MTCMVVFLIRERWIKRWWVSICYHGILFLILVPIGVGYGGVQNTAYHDLEVFRQLEKNNQVAEARKDPAHYKISGSLALDFETSDAFHDYIRHTYDSQADKLFAIIIGWLVALMCDLVIAIVCLLRRFFKSRKIALF